MFDENSTLKEALEAKNGREVLADNGVPCISCAMAAGEMDFLTIGEIADTYGLDKNKIIDDLNKK